MAIVGSVRPANALGMRLPVSGGTPTPSGPWTPANLASTRGWWQADLLAGADNSAIASWPDTTANAFNATGVNNPTLQTAELNSKNVVQVSYLGSQYFSLPSGTLTGLTQGAIFFVCKIDSDPPATDPSSGPVPGDFGSDAPNPDFYPIDFDSNVYGQFLSTTRKQAGNPTPSLASWHIGEFRSQASDWQFYVNGTQVFQTSTNTVGTNSAPKFGMSTASGTPSTYLNGMMAEIVLTSSFLTTDERQRVEGYLAWKWGASLVAALDASNPYKAAPPTV